MIKFRIIFKNAAIGIGLLLVSFSLHAVEIKGTVQLQEDWQPIVFLASLNAPENLFVASPDFVIAKAFIQPDGSFSLQTVIPNDARFYRLYLMKGNNSSVEFNTSVHRNYQHLLLQQDSQVQFNAKVVDNTLIVNSFKVSDENSAILSFDKEMASRKQQLAGDITKAKRDFLTTDLNNFIRHFVDTTRHALVGLYALYHLDEKDTDFLRHSEFYFNFQKKLEEQYSHSYYSEEYEELLKSLIGFREMVCEIPGVQPKWKDQLLIGEGILILILFFIVVGLWIKQKQNVQNRIGKNVQLNLYEGLTTKQKEILKLLAEGKTNKEIAQDLFVELSTVKTHINNIYRQLNVTTRKEASSFYISIIK